MQLGDYIIKSEVQTREGSAKYRAMADYANRMGYVIEEHITTIPPTVEEGGAVFDDFMDYKDVAVYMICEPPVSEPPTRKEALEQELAEINAWYDKHHYIAEKIAYGRATRDEYADVIAETEVKARRVNEIRAELKTMEISERIENKEYLTRQDARDTVGMLYTEDSITIEQMNSLTVKIDKVYGDDSIQL